MGCRGEKVKKAINGLKIMEELHAEILLCLYSKGQDLYNLSKHFLDVGRYLCCGPLNILHIGVGAIQDRDLGDLLAKTKSTLVSARKSKQSLMDQAECKDRPRTTKRERQRERERD